MLNSFITQSYALEAYAHISQILRFPMDDRESVTDSSCTLPIVEKYMFQIKMNYSLKPAVLIGASPRWWNFPRTIRLRQTKSSSRKQLFHLPWCKPRPASKRHTDKHSSITSDIVTIKSSSPRKVSRQTLLVNHAKKFNLLDHGEWLGGRAVV